MATWDVTTVAASLEFETDYCGASELCQIDDNHFLVVYESSSNDGFTRVLEVNTTTWVVSVTQARFEFYTLNIGSVAPILIGENHVVVFHSGDGGNGFAECLEINTTTWAVTTAIDPLEFDTNAGYYNQAFLLDENHILNIWYGGTTNDGWAQVFEVNTTTWAVTTSAASLSNDTRWDNISAEQIDENHFIIFFRGEINDGFTEILEVNTTTWAVTTTMAELEFDTQDVSWNACAKIDDNHFINAWNSVTDTKGRAQVFEVNTTTWVVTTVGAVFEFGATGAFFSGFNLEKIDTNHFLISYADSEGGSGTGYSKVLEVNTTTWAVSTVASTLTFSVTRGEWNYLLKVDDNHFLNSWRDTDNDGFIQVFNVEWSPAGYTRGDYAALPSDDANLENDYDAQDLLDIASKDDDRVDQTGAGEYILHQYKDDVGALTAVSLEWEGQSDLAPSSSIVKLQIYNRDTPGWEDVDSDNVANAGTDFTLEGDIPDLTNYKDASNIICCRVWQEATA